MTTRIIPTRTAEMTLAAEGIVSVKLFDEDPALYNSNAIGDKVDRTGYPGQVVDAPGSSILRLMDIATLVDSDDGPGFYAAIRGALASWAAAILFESDDDTADFHQIATFDTPAVIGFARGILPSVANTNTWDYASTLEVELLGGELESLDEDETMKARVGYLIGSEIVLCQNVEQLSARRWRLNGPMVRGWKGTEWAVGTHKRDEVFVVLEENAIQRINDELSDIGLERFFKAVTSGTSLESAQRRTFTNTGVSLKPWSPVDIEASFSGNDIVGTFRRRSRLWGRNGRDFFDPPLGEATEAYEIDILSDDETEVKRTLNSTSETFTYLEADQITDFGALKEHNLHVNIYQMSAAVGRGYPGHAVLNPIGFSESAVQDMQFEDDNPMDFEDGGRMEFESA